MAQAYDAVIATIVVASDATSVTKAMVKSTTWREGTSGEWNSTSCTLEAGKTYQFRTPNSGSGSGTTAVLPNIKASVAVGWDTSGNTITSVGTYFLSYYAYGCNKLTSLSVPDTSGLTTVGSSFMDSYAGGCTSLTSLSVPDTSGLTTVGDYFMAGYANGCSSLTSLILKGNTGWFSGHNVSWNVPSSRLNYLYAYCESAYWLNWKGLTATDKTLYLNYVQSTSYVKTLGTQANLIRGLYIKGYSTGNSNMGLYTQGYLTNSSERGLYIEGFVRDFYSRESASDLESDDTALATTFSEQDYTDVESDDNVYVDLQGTARYMKFLFREFNENKSGTQKFTITWKGKSSVAPSTSPVYLQVYNRTLEQWETLASNNTSPANTKFTLTGTQSTNLGDYYDSNYVISVRVYQDGMV